MRALVLGFFFISGLCGLLYEVVWIRVAGTVIGNTTYAVGTVVAVFMGGLALGAWAGGRAADRRQGADLLRLYGFLEAGVALLALAVPFLLAASEPVFRILWDHLGGIAWLYAALRVLLVGLVLIAPTTLMGATLPVLSRFLSLSGEAAAGQAGLAYATNTFGGVAGTLLSGFWMIPWLGLRATTQAAVALNLAIGAASVLLARGKPGLTHDRLPPGPPPDRTALGVAALSGFSALVYEVTWTRSLVISMGSTVYAFTIILATFILGLAAGSAAGSRFVGRAERARPALGLLQGGIGILALVLLPLLGDLPLRIAAVVASHRSSFGSLLRSEGALIALFIFVPTFLMGAVFPFAFRMASGSADAVGRSVGAVYTWNTLGSIAGSLAASFLLVPWFGLASSIKIAATVNLAVSAALLFTSSPALRRMAAVPALAALVAWILPGWDPRVTASGAYLYGERAEKLNLDLRTYIRTESKMVAEYWDAYGLTTVHESAKTGLSIRVNGKADASTSTEDMPTQRLVGHLGLLHHPAPRRVLVIGLGSGVTLGAVAEHTTGAVDCVEISDAGRRAALHFARANGNVLENPRVHLRIGDGRNALQFARVPYDVIVSQPSNLWISGMANLFTKDFFQIASERLSPGGIFCQWVQAYRLPLEDFQLILRTFFSVFREGSLWEVFPGQDYILLGSLEPIQRTAGDLERDLRAPDLAGDYRSSDSPPVPLLLGHFIAQAAAVRSAAGPSPVLTDDLCSIEYSVSRAMFDRLQPRTLLWLDPLRRNPLPGELYPGADLARVSESREWRRQIASVIVYESERHAAHEVLEYVRDHVGRVGDDPHVQEYFDSIANFARIDAQVLIRSGRYPLAARVLQSIPRSSKHYPDALFDRALLGRLAGDREEARRSARELHAEYAGGFAEVCLGALEAPGDRGPESAVPRWQEAIRLRPDSDYAHAHLADCLFRLGRRDEAREACRKALEIDASNDLAKKVLDDLGGPR
jgi:spermidine synthase